MCFVQIIFFRFYCALYWLCFYFICDVQFTVQPQTFHSSNKECLSLVIFFFLNKKRVLPVFLRIYEWHLGVCLHCNFSWSVIDLYPRIMYFLCQVMNAQLEIDQPWQLLLYYELQLQLDWYWLALCVEFCCFQTFN